MRHDATAHLQAPTGSDMFLEVSPTAVEVTAASATPPISINSSKETAKQLCVIPAFGITAVLIDGFDTG